MTSPAFDVQYEAQPGPARKALIEGDVDDRATPLYQRRQGGANHQERAGEVDTERALPAFERLLEDGRAVADACVVDQHVDAAEALDRG